MINEVMKMTAHQYKEGKYDKAILALGSCECHGPHLAQGTYTLVSHMLSVKAADELKGLLVLPPVTVGCSEHYATFPFTISLSFETMIAVIKDILRTTYNNGIKHIFIMNGHDGNIYPAEVATRQIKVELPDIKIAFMSEWWIKAGQLLPKGTFEVWDGLGHAGEGESSIAYYLYEEWCEPALAAGVVPDRLPADVNMQWLFGEITNTGATGDPTKGTKEKGRKMTEVLVKCIVDSIKALDARGWDYKSSKSAL
jgi:creatinine amidohydrolase